MTVPQQAVLFHNNVGRRGNTLRIRLTMTQTIRFYGGTAIAVPYIAIFEKG